MKHALILIISVGFFHLFADCSSKQPLSTGNGQTTQLLKQDTLRHQMKIKIGDQTFIATLVDNETVRAFQAMLPLTLEMSDLNANEKYYHLPTDLPTNASNPGTIYTGDLMLWRSNSLVLFYKTFDTSYAYTSLGRIDDPAGLAAAVGGGRVKVTFER